MWTYSRSAVTLSATVCTATGSASFDAGSGATAFQRDSSAPPDRK
jgi:hypothetical protein